MPSTSPASSSLPITTSTNGSSFRMVRCASACGSVAGSQLHSLRRKFRSHETVRPAARAAGLTVSCDLNFRRKLWSWDPATDPQALAQRTMRKLLPFVDVVIGNEEDAGEVLGIHAADTDVQSGKVQSE